MSLINHLTPSIVATLERTNYKSVLNSNFKMIDSIHFITNVDLALHKEKNHVNALQLSEDNLALLKFEWL